MKPNTLPSETLINFAFDLDAGSAGPDPLGGLRPQFFLRRDFAIELGFLSVLPEPPARPHFGEIRTLGLRGVVRQLRGWAKGWLSGPSLPHLYLCGGLFLPSPTEGIDAIAFVCDGRHVIYPDPSGPFSDITLRIQMTMPLGQAHLVYPGRRLNPNPYKTVPPCLIVHDPRMGLADILPAGEAIKRVLIANGFFVQAQAPKGAS